MPRTFTFWCRSPAALANDWLQFGYKTRLDQTVSELSGKTACSSDCVMRCGRADLGSLSLPAFWRLSTDRVSVSRVLVVYEIAAQRAVCLARRYGQGTVLLVQRIPFEHVVVLTVANQQCVQGRRYEPAVIADVLTRMFGGGAVAVEYVPAGWFESLAVHGAERRLA